MQTFFKQNRDVWYVSAAFTTLIVAGGLINRSGVMKSSAEYESSPVIASISKQESSGQVPSVRSSLPLPGDQQTDKAAAVLPESESPFWMSPIDVTIIEPAQPTEEIVSGEPKEIPAVDAWLPPVETEPVVVSTPKSSPLIESPSPERRIEPTVRKKTAPSPMDDRYVETFGVPLPKVDIIDVIPAEAKPAVAKNNAEPEKKTPPTSETGSEWIPFIYFYQKSNCRFVPDRILYVFPTVSSQPNGSDTQNQTNDKANDETKNADKKSDRPQETILEESVCVPCPAVQPTMPPMYPMYNAPYYAPIAPMQPVVVPYQAMPYPPQPVMQPTMLPVYMPSMVLPSRFGHGSPRLIYPNGVVVKPKVYLPGQPLKNVVRAVTP